MKKILIFPILALSIFLAGCSTTPENSTVSNNSILSEKNTLLPLSFNQYDVCEVDKLPIKDENNLIVQEGKKNFLATTKISKDYFNEHFTFQCAGEQAGRDGYENSSPPQWVIYQYSIGDYTIQVSIYAYFEWNNQKVAPRFEGLEEINNVLSQEEAIEKLSSCVKGEAMNISLDLNKQGLFMKGNSQSQLFGTLNLQTGECTSNQSQGWDPH